MCGHNEVTMSYVVKRPTYMIGNIEKLADKIWFLSLFIKYNKILLLRFFEVINIQIYQIGDL